MDRKLLYGPYSDIWGHYTGNEAALLSELPIFSSNDKFYSAISPYWTFDGKQEGILEITKEKLDSLFVPYNPIPKTTIEINSGQMVAQAGPKYLEHLESIFAGNNSGCPILEEWIEVQDGFKICCKYSYEIDSILKRIGEYAIKEFDSELKAANCGYISEKANAAAEIFSANSRIEKMTRFYRMAIARLVANNTKGYNRILRLSSIEFDEPVEVLDKLVHTFYEAKYCK